MAPEDWTETSIGELADVRLGKTAARDAYLDAGDYRIVKFKDLKQGAIDWFPDSKGYVSSSKGLQELYVGTTLITASAHSEGHIGKKLAFVDRIPTSNGRAWYVGELLGVRPRESSRMVERWPLYWFQSSRGQEEIGEAIRGGHLTGSRAKEMTVVVPPLEEQRKIAAILSSVDDAADATQLVVDQLQVVKNAMMAELLTRGLPGRHTRFKMTDIGELPEEWEVMPMADFVVEMVGGSPLRPDDFTERGASVLHKGDIQRDGILQLRGHSSRYTSAAFAAAHERSVIDSQFLALTLRDLVPSGPSIGLIARVPEGRFVLAQGAYGIRLNPERMEPEFLIALANSAWYRANIFKLAVGSTQIHIRNGDFLGFRVPVPQSNERRAIGRAISSIVEAVTIAKNKVQALTTLKSALISVLLTGEVRVKLG